MQIASASILILLMTGCGITVNKSGSSTTEAASILSFKASASAVSAGGSVVLTWSVTNAATLSIDNGVGTVTGTTVSVKPAANTTYTLTATNSAGAAVKASTNVGVVALPVITAFSSAKPLITPATIAGDTLNWQVAGASSVAIDNGIGKVTANTANVSPIATTTYTLTAANSLGTTVTATTTIKVRNTLAAIAGAADTASTAASYAADGYFPCAYPYALASDAAGNLYIADPGTDSVCKVSTTGAVTLLAGDGTANYAPAVKPAPGGSAQARIAARNASHMQNPAWNSAFAGGLFTKLQLLNHPRRQSMPSNRGAVPMDASSSNAGFVDPVGIAVSADGTTIYVADDLADTISRISIAADGSASVAVVAGTVRTCGYIDGPGPQAAFCNPEQIALDSSGNLFVADQGNDLIRKVTFASDGSGTVTTFAGIQGQCGTNDGLGNLAQFCQPTGIALDSTGNVYVADTGNQTLRKIVIDADSPVIVSTLGPSGAPWLLDQPTALTIDHSGSIYIADTGAGTIYQIAFAADGSYALNPFAGTSATLGHEDADGTSSWFRGPTGLAPDAAGNLYVADFNQYSYELGDLRKIVISTGQVSTDALNLFGGTGGNADGLGASATFNLPAEVAIDSKGNYYVADMLNSTIRKIVVASDGTATVSTLAGTSGQWGDADGTAGAAQFYAPQALVVSPDGSSLYVADSGNATIRQVDASTGKVKTLAGTNQTYGTEDGTGSSAQFENPTSITVDAAGTIYVGDFDVIRTVDPVTGAVATMTLTNGTGGALAFGNVTGVLAYTNPSTKKNYLYAAVQCSIYQIDLSTMVGTPFAGSATCGYTDGAGSAAQFQEIWNLAVDSQGDLYASDLGNNLIRRITPAGVVTTVAGTFNSASAALGPLPASLYFPLGVAIDPTDNLVIAVPNALLTLVP
ncbi:MAG TPA: hypothetical protein VGG85_01010 [Terracidiphilus sp.]